MTTEAPWHRPRTVSVVVDNPSWILPYAERLVAACWDQGDKAYLCRNHGDVRHGAVAFYLGCLRITPPEIVARNAWNLVVHESGLPLGRGFAPLNWQILEGRNEIPVCLLHIAAEPDAGSVVYRDMIRFQGHELASELRAAQGAKTVELCLRFLAQAEPPAGRPQKGEPTWYPRRRPADSRLNPDQTIAEQFNLLRIVDNQAYPAFFDLHGERYTLRIERVAADEEIRE